MGRTRVAGDGCGRATALLIRLVLGASSGTVACGGAPNRYRPESATHTRDTAALASASASDRGEVFSFPELTQSPLGFTQVPATLSPFLAQCKVGDAALGRVAERVARRRAQGKPALDSPEIGFALRAEGSPYLAPRTWTLKVDDLASSDPVERMQDWLASFNDGGERRCGVALATTPERSVLAAVAIDALADLEPLPVRVRAGTWLDINASMLVPADDAKIIVLGPSGAPYAVPTSFDGRRARARFNVDRPGAYLLQLLASVAGGPRPVLEATVYADAPPPTSFVAERVPGEPSQPLATNADAAASLLGFVNMARQSEERAALARDATLDGIAERHALAMLKLGRIAHDAGDGDPASRVESAGLDVLVTGENVAHAADVTRAHRVLWSSPSHRENLLQPRFDRVGIGIARDRDGSLWVCEVFADFPD
jgi:uncharacterized protein YkwD